MLEGECGRCGSREVYVSRAPGGIWNSESALLQKIWTDAGPAVTDGWRAVVCTGCGHCEFYLTDEKVLAEIAGAPPGKAWSKLVPAGWYADPAGRHESRYWDGLRWTPAVGDGGQRADDPLGSTG